MGNAKKGGQPNNKNAVKHNLTAHRAIPAPLPSNIPWDAEADLQGQIQALDERYTAFKGLIDRAASDGTASFDSLTKAEAALTTLIRARLKAIGQLEQLQEQRRRRIEHEAFFGGAGYE